LVRPNETRLEKIRTNQANQGSNPAGVPARPGRPIIEREKMIKTWKRNLRIIVPTIILTVFAMIAAGGCMEYDQREIEQVHSKVEQVHSKVADIALAVGKVDYQNDETMDILKALQAGTAASAPFNPYALPIGAGLTGIIAVLEALRRKEKDGRKYAEHELNNIAPGYNNNHK